MPRRVLDRRAHTSSLLPPTLPLTPPCLAVQMVRVRGAAPLLLVSDARGRVLHATSALAARLAASSGRNGGNDAACGSNSGICRVSVASLTPSKLTAGGMVHAMDALLPPPFARIHRQVVDQEKRLQACFELLCRGQGLRLDVVIGWCVWPVKSHTVVHGARPLWHMMDRHVCVAQHTLHAMWRYLLHDSGWLPRALFSLGLPWPVLYSGTGTITHWRPLAARPHHLGAAARALAYASTALMQMAGRLA
jgi:hypothetical protein